MKDITSKITNFGRKAAAVSAIVASLSLGVGIAYGEKSIIDYVRELPDKKAFTVPCNPGDECKEKEYMRSGNVILYRTDKTDGFGASGNSGWQEAQENLQNYKVISRLYGQHGNSARAINQEEIKGNLQIDESPVSEESTPYQPAESARQYSKSDNSQNAGTTRVAEAADKKENKNSQKKLAKSDAPVIEPGIASFPMGSHIIYGTTDKKDESSTPISYSAGLDYIAGGNISTTQLDFGIGFGSNKFGIGLRNSSAPEKTLHNVTLPIGPFEFYGKQQLKNISATGWVLKYDRSIGDKFSIGIGYGEDVWKLIQDTAEGIRIAGADVSANQSSIPFTQKINPIQLTAGWKVSSRATLKIILEENDFDYGKRARKSGINYGLGIDFNFK